VPISLFAVKDYGNGSVGETDSCLFFKKSVLTVAVPL
jgi:hypothetical protein